MSVQNTDRVIRLLIIAGCLVASSNTKNIEIITVVPYDVGVAPDIRVTGAAYDLAAEGLMKVPSRVSMTGTEERPINVTITHLFNAANSDLIQSCNDIASRSVALLADYYTKHYRGDTCYAVVTTPCNDLEGINSLATGFDLPLFTTSIAKHDFVDPMRGSPESVATCGIFASYTAVLIEILRDYAWFRVTVILDTTAAPTFYRDLGNTFLEDVKVNRSDAFEVELYALKDINSDEAITGALTFARMRSRVLVLLTPGLATIRILKMADSLGMSKDGEYAFINVQPLLGIAYANLNQFLYHLNNTNSKALRSLILVAYGLSDNNMRNLNAQLAAKALTNYNYSFPAGSQPLDSFSVKASYDVVELFATAVQEMNGIPIKSNSNGNSGCSGLHVVQRLRNRTFQLTSGEVFINAESVRNLDLQIYDYNTSTASIQALGGYKWQTGKFIWDKAHLIEWPTADGLPPKNKPACGFLEARGSCGGLSMTSQAVTASMVVALTIFGMALAAWCFLPGWRERVDYSDCALIVSSWAKNLEIITSLPYNIGLAVDVQRTAGAFDLAAEGVVRTSYHRQIPMNISIKHLFNADNSHLVQSCRDVEALSSQMLAEYYIKHGRSDTCYAVVSSVCSDSIGIASFVKGFDLPLFSNGITKRDFVDANLGSPAAVSICGVFSSYSQVVIEILRAYAWYRVTVIIDMSAVSNFYRDLATVLLEDASKARNQHPFEMELYRLTDATAIVDALKFAKSRSRVLVLVAAGLITVQILGAADSLGLSETGEYAFINIQPLLGVEFSNVSHFLPLISNTNSTALRSLIVVSYGLSANNMRGLNARIADRVKTVSNLTWPYGSQPLDSFSIQTSYDVVEVFAAAIQEISRNGSGPSGEDQHCSGLKVVEYLRNRTFHLTAGEAFIDPERIRNLDLQIYAYNTSTSDIQVIGKFNWRSTQLVWDGSYVVEWPTTGGLPPKNIPPCGFSDDQGMCAVKGQRLTPITQAVAAAVVVSATVIFALILWRALEGHKINRSGWWKLQCKDLCPAAGSIFRPLAPPVVARKIVLLTKLPYNVEIAADVQLNGAAFKLAAKGVNNYSGDAPTSKNSNIVAEVKYLFDASNSQRIETCGDVEDYFSHRLSHYY
ncbi:hypothetical protein BV898_01216 [Hypsibius exemplaris]|uniref:Receptor ligand binding region domain-containing protein n=1 Tax=Hypsibius exemplaris TaxID=2072580 RepID=A0A1W0XC74_HYPEX|nr:hypothetical protein BV898_01216 [Hypsibius exemplaris]